MNITRDNSKVKRYVHFPFRVGDESIDGISASCDKDGKVTITHTSGEEYESVTVPASFIFTIANMLNTTKKIKYIDREDIPSSDRG